MTHKCSAIFCNMIVNDTKLMCPSCWFSVPDDTRKVVYAEWNSVVKNGGTLTTRYMLSVFMAQLQILRQQKSKNYLHDGQPRKHWLVPLERMDQQIFIRENYIVQYQAKLARESANPAAAITGDIDRLDLN